MASRASPINALEPINSKSLCPSRARVNPSMTIGCDSQTYTLMVSTQFLLDGIGGTGVGNMVLRLKSLRLRERVSQVFKRTEARARPDCAPHMADNCPVTGEYRRPKSVKFMNSATWFCRRCFGLRRTLPGLHRRITLFPVYE